MTNKLNDILPKENDILLYQTDRTLLLFKYTKRVPSGFVVVDKDRYRLLAGRAPIGLEQGNFIINYTIIDIFTDNDLQDFVDIEFEDYIYRLYRVVDRVLAYKNLDPSRIVGSFKLDNYVCLKLNKI